jgi:hypothetical protein
MGLATLSGKTKMGIKDLWSRTTARFSQRQGPREHEDFQPDIDHEGLMADGQEKPANGNGIAVKRKNGEAIEKLQAGFDELITQLRGINQHLNTQVGQHEELMKRIERLPEMLESWPAAVENQKTATEGLLEQLKGNLAKDQQLLEAVERIPNETGKQTDALVQIDQQLAAAADVDTQMVEGLNRFNERLEQLGKATVGHRESILQMNKTFAASDRYLKYIMTRQNRRFWWIFFTAIGVCAAVIAVFAAIIIYLAQR